LLQTPFPLWYLGIAIGIAGFGLIAYGVISDRKKGPTAKEIAVKVREQQNQQELDQINRQNEHQNERDDRYTPANIK
jgi:hypothetical protein